MKLKNEEYQGDVSSQLNNLTLKKRKTIAESHRFLVEICVEHVLAVRKCQKLFARFKSDDFGLEDEERPGQPNNV